MIIGMLVWIFNAEWGGSQDFLSGKFEDGYGVSLYVTPEGELRTIGNDWDLNDDGWLDLVVINEMEWQNGRQVHDTYSYVFWGGPEGFERTNCDSFETHGAECAALADFDRDGWTDIVIANSTCEYSYLIYGSPQGYTHAKRDSFRARANHGSISVADLDRDGWLDLVWSNWFSYGGGYSRIYWGSPEGFDVTRTDSLSTGPAHGNIVADFDANGYADIFWAVYYNTYDPTRNPSLIYWGAEAGFSEESKTELPTVGPGDDISVGDFNKDGFLDIVIPNHSSEPPPAWTAYDYSYIYYGLGNRQFRMDSLYAYGPWASSVADIDDDGWLDIVFACSADSRSLLYKGSNGSFNEVESLSLSRISCSLLADFDADGRCDMAMGTQSSASVMNVLYQGDQGWDKHSMVVKGMDAGITKDLGNPATHEDEAYYVSPVITVTRSMDSLALLEGCYPQMQTSWHGAEEASGAEVKLWVSASPNPEGGEWSEWIEFAPQMSHNIAGRAFRYKLCFKTGMRTSVILDKVEFDWQTGGNPLIVRRAGRYFDISLDLSTLESSKPLVIYDRVGRRMRTLQYDQLGHAYWFGDDDSGQPLPPGVYFLVVPSGDAYASCKLVLLAE